VIRRLGAAATRCGIIPVAALLVACPSATVDDPLVTLRASAPAGVAIVLQSADCASREDELRVMAREVPHLHVLLLHSSRRAGDAGEQMVEQIFAARSFRRFSTRNGRALVQLGVSATPALVAWRAPEDSVTVVVLESDRSNMREAVRWAMRLPGIEGRAGGEPGGAPDLP
jgi:hypothetical protein